MSKRAAIVMGKRETKPPTHILKWVWRNVSLGHFFTIILKQTRLIEEHTA